MKNGFALLLAGLLLLTLAACGRGGDRREDDPPPAPPDGMMDKTYTETCYPFPGGYKIKDAARLDGRLLLLGTVTEWDNRAGWAVTADSALALLDYTVSGTGRVILSEARVLSGDEEGGPVLSVTAGGDGYFYALAAAGEENRSSGTVDYTVLRYDGDGSQVDSMSVTLPTADWSTNDLIVTGDGTIVVNTAPAVFVLRWQEGVTAVWETGDWTAGYWAYPSMASAVDGVLLASYNGVYRLDTDTGEAVPAEMAFQDDERQYLCDYECQGLDGEYLSLVKGDGFYEYGAEADRWELLLPVSRASCYGSACRLSDDDFAVCMSGTEALVLTGAERVPYEEDTRSTVKVAAVTAYGDLLGYLFDAYADDPLYDYQVTVYDCRAEREDNAREVTAQSAARAVERLLVEMMAGDVPDLVVSMENCLHTDNAMFEDLYPYIDADPELSRDGFLPNFLEALSCNGELRQLWTRTGIQTVYARASDVSGGYGFTASDYTRMVEENPAYRGVFHSEMTRDAYLYVAARMGASLFVDKENAEARFDDPAFSELLAWGMSMPEESHTADGAWAWELGEELLMSSSVDMQSLLTSASYTLAQWGVGPGALVPVGYPDGGEGFSWYRGNISYAIPAGSRNKEGAWAFIRSQFTLEPQLDEEVSFSYLLGGMPVIYEALERELDGRVKSGTLEPEGKELVEETMRRTKYAETYSDKELQDLIVGFGQAYLAGDRTLEETVAQIQSRAKIYVAERYG